MKKENYISKSEFKRVLDMIHASGMSKSKFAIKAGINPASLTSAINRGSISRKMYEKIEAVSYD